MSSFPKSALQLPRTGQLSQLTDILRVPEEPWDTLGPKQEAQRQAHTAASSCSSAESWEGNVRISQALLLLDRPSVPCRASVPPVSLQSCLRRNVPGRGRDGEIGVLLSWALGTHKSFWRENAFRLF